MNELQQEIKEWKERNGLKKRSLYSPIIEAVRRINQFHKGDVNSRLILLEFPSHVKDVKELIVPYSKERKRCLNWYGLTARGKEIVKDLKIEWSEEVNQELLISL